MSSPAILAAQGAIISGVSWVLWRTLRGMFVKSDLGNLPGPEAASFFMGEQWTLDLPAAKYAHHLLFLFLSFAGNFGQIFSADGWDFHKKLPEQREGRPHVGPIQGTPPEVPLSIIPMTNCALCEQSKHVYVFDPKALHHIVVKDQYIFEESRAFVTCVLVLPARVSRVCEI
ncbi:hypothetical protein H0H81_011762 [Sphagnurus paluster]|uniref:Uncharacterized protein n=1 Tax=Sphagnurus paluster TaxID=117069 RepID=A0A9P7GNK0_9AGAR|nr:hypothetical protein H0H81_011762 [Sphagnurus paluster]